MANDVNLLGLAQTRKDPDEIQKHIKMEKIVGHMKFYFDKARIITTLEE